MRQKAMSQPSLDGARAKVERAREHIAELDKLAAEYVDESGSVEFYTTKLADGWTAGRVRTNAPPPQRLALVCGDAVHNLRTALDYLVWQIGIADTGIVSTRSLFPIVQPERAAHWASIAGDRLALLSKDHVEAVRLLQPFVDQSDGSPNVILGALDAMENRDKHRLELPVATAVFKADFAVSAGVRGLEVVSGRRDPVVLEGDVELYRLRAVSATAASNVHSVAHVGVRFGNPDGPTTEMLRGMANTVAGIVGTFELDIRAIAS